MIIDKHLRTWLSFDDADNRVKDNLGDAWNWYASGGTIVTGAIHGTAIRIQVSNVYSRSPMQLGGDDFTIQFYSRAILNSTTTNVSGVFSLSARGVTTAAGQLFQLKDVQNTGEYIFDYNAAGAPVSSVSELTSYNTGVIAPDSWVHVAIVYQHTIKKLTLFLGGVKVLERTLDNEITRQGWYHHIGLSRALTNGNTQYGWCIIDEFSVHDGVALYTDNFTPPGSSYYDDIVVDFATERTVLQAWRYENPGRADLLTISGGTTLSNLPALQSTTGVAFYQPTQSACFGIAATKEIWIRCDIYTTSNYNNGDRLRIYNIGSDNKANGFSTNATIRYQYMLWHNSIQKNGVSGLASNKLQTILVHMKSDASNGVVEYRFMSGEGDKYTGNVNNGNDFDNVFIQMDGSNIWVSNVVISDEQIEFADIDYSYDTVRSQYLNIADYGDLLRTVYKPVTLIADTERKINGILVNDVYDTERVLSRTITATYDMMRQIPHDISDTQEGVLQSLTISLQEQQLTDNISFVMAGDIDIMDAVTFQAWDYILHCRAEETSKKGVLLSCKCTVDIDEMLYKQMSYVIPESEWEWTNDYLAKYNKYKIEHEDAEYLKKMPSALASTHINKIANALGLNVSMQFQDWVSTMSTEVKSGTNYAGLISELVGWTSRLPHLMINCYIRENTLYVIQRGHESNTITLDGNKLSVHTVTKKLIRTTWGSEVTSETLVVPYYDEWWMEGEKQPLPEDMGSGYTLDENGLVDGYVNEYGDGTRTVVTCNYSDTFRFGRMLSRETAVSSDGFETITVHEPIGINQKKVVTYDEDGILGSTVSPSNMDDRVTPYQSSSTYSDGTIVSDINGNKYLLLSLIYHKEKVDEKKRTVHGIALIDTSFPVDGQAMLEFLTQQIMWLDRKTEESVTLEIYDYPHLIDFNDKIVWHGNTYYLRANTAVKNENIINKQTLEFVRWY